MHGPNLGGNDVIYFAEVFAHGYTIGRGCLGLSTRGGTTSVRLDVLWPRTSAAVALAATLREHRRGGQPVVEGPDEDRARDSERTDREPLSMPVMLELASTAPGLVAELIELFEVETGARLSELSEAVRRGDRTSVADLAHRIRGSATVFGAAALEEACRRLEHGDPAIGLDALGREVAHQYGRVLRALHAFSGRDAVGSAPAGESQPPN